MSGRLLRFGIAAGAAVTLAVGVVVALGTVASAGGNMHVDVNLVTIGTAPPGTTFTVHYSCTPGGVSGDLMFDAAGNPDPPASNFFNDGNLHSTCTITETVTGGASVAYQCADDGVNATCASPTSNQVTFDSPTDLSNNVTVTVTNTFASASPPLTVTSPATASFTG
jgi:hypothetical protein